MSLVTPILSPKSAFDATKSEKFTFYVSPSSDQVVKNKLIIRDNSDNSIIYSSTITTFNFEHTIPLNTLQNNKIYNAQVSTFNISNQESQLSNSILFYTFTTPTLSLDVNEGIINSSSFNFPSTYTQSEGEEISSYQYYLYDSNDELISTSPVKYDTTLEYTFTGFHDNFVYGVELKILTAHGMEVSTGIIPFSVNYLRPNIPTVFNLENMEKYGYIKVSGSIVTIKGNGDVDDYTFDSNDFIDLTNGDTLIVDDGFEIKGDFTIKIWMKNPTNRKPFYINTNKSNSTQKLELLYFDNKIEVYQKNGNLTYYTYSNTISSPLANDLLCVWVRRTNGLFDITLTNLN